MPRSARWSPAPLHSAARCFAECWPTGPTISTGQRWVWPQLIVPRWSARASSWPWPISLSRPAGSSGKEPVAHGNGGHHARQIGQQCTANRVSHPLDAYRSKVNGHYIKSGFGAALYRGCHQGRETVDAEVLHRFDQHGSGGTAREGLDQRGGQRVDETGVEP